MDKHEKLRLRILAGGADANIRFQDLCALLEHLGFEKKKGKGSHYIFKRPGIVEMPVLQEGGGNAKPYQVRQVRGILAKYDLGGNS